MSVVLLAPALSLEAGESFSPAFAFLDEERFLSSLSLFFPEVTDHKELWKLCFEHSISKHSDLRSYLMI